MTDLSPTFLNAIADSIFAVFFFFLLAWVLKTSDKREERLTGLLDKYCEKLETMGQTLTTITNALNQIDERLSNLERKKND